MNERASLVEGYASRGWHCFPIKVGGKHPATRSGVYAGTTDLVTLRQWWRTDYNIGIWTGASNLVVVDCDLDDEPSSWRTGGPTPGLADWADMCGRYGGQPETYEVVTPSGGIHIYFTVPEDVEIRPSAGKLAPLIDIRGGPSYVVAAGSKREDGLVWEVIDDRPVAPAPAWLLELVRHREPPVDDAIDRAFAGERSGSRAYSYVEEGMTEVRSARPGIRNETLNGTAWRLFRHTQHAEHEYVRQGLMDVANEIGLGSQEAKWTVESAHRSACLG